MTDVAIGAGLLLLKIKSACNLKLRVLAHHHAR
jgi:hypothetical protein